MNTERTTQDGIWILGAWRDLPSGANWEITGAFPTRDQAVAEGQSGEFVARLPMGRSPSQLTVLPDAEWIDEIRSQEAGR